LILGFDDDDDDDGSGGGGRRRGKIRLHTEANSFDGCNRNLGSKKLGMS
jgi:hypothetical protein